MASRSTRNKLRYQADKTQDNLDRVLENLRYIDHLAEGQSPYINENIPKLVVIIEGVKVLFEQFRSGL